LLSLPYKNHATYLRSAVFEHCYQIISQSKLQNGDFALKEVSDSQRKAEFKTGTIKFMETILEDLRQARSRAFSASFLPKG
jgi:hypothetical protein